MSRRIDLEALFGDADAPGFWLDPEGRIGWLNAAARTITMAAFGHEAEVGDSIFDVVLPGARAAFDEGLAGALGGQTSVARRWVDFPSGLSFSWDLRHVPTRDADDRVTGVLFTATNRTFAIEASARLRAVEQALDLSPTPFAIVRKTAPRNAEVVLVNHAFAALLGRSVDELVGHDWASAFDHDTRPAIADALERRHGLHVAIHDPRSPGAWIPLRLEPIAADEGEVLHFLVSRAGPTLDEPTLASATRLERESVLADVASATAHDVANLVTVVAMSASALDPSDAFGQAFLELAERAVAKLRRLGRVTRSRAPFFEVRAALRALEPLLVHALSDRAELVVDPRMDEALVAFPQASFERIVLGLVANARRAAGDALGCVAIRIQTDRTHVRVTVSDDGPLSPSVRASAVDDPTAETPLLSLHAAVRELRAFGGELAMMSGPGDVRFELTLPRTELDPVPAPTARGGDETVWLVEREPLLARTTGRMLESLGYRVYVTESPEPPLDHTDVVIADLVVGAMELLRGASLPGMPLVMTTAELFDVPSFDAATRPVVFLRKPFSGAELDAAIRRALALRG